MTHRLTLWAACLIAPTLMLLAPPIASAINITYDFDTGPGPDFVSFSSFDLYSLDLDGADLRIAKPADDGSANPNSFVTGGVRTTYGLIGDFTATVDFTLNNLPPATPGTAPLNESVFGAVGSNPDDLFLVLRFRQAAMDRIEGFSSLVGPIGVSDSNLLTGRYQIQRLGNELFARFAPAGSDMFTDLGSATGFTSESFALQLYAAQGASIVGAARSNTALDISFDNLIIQTVAVTPEPTALLAFTLAALLLRFRRRARRASSNTR